MKKSVAFEKDLSFPTMIGEISSISLDEDLSFVDSSNVSGNFVISGKYKMTEASRLEEEFSFDIPIEISLIESFDLSTANIHITDFTYEVVDDDTLRSHITVLIEGIEEVSLSDEDVDSVENVEQVVEQDVVERNDEENSYHNIIEVDCEERECDGDMKEEKEIPVKENDTLNNNTNVSSTFLESNSNEMLSSNVQKTSVSKESNLTDKVGSLFSNLDDDDDTFKTYSIYIMREGDMLEGVMDKYKVSKEDLENYNDLANIQVNSKVIVPTGIDEE